MSCMVCEWLVGEEECLIIDGNDWNGFIERDGKM